MEHVDAKAIRERLHAISLAVSTLDALGRTPHDEQIAERARQAVGEITILINCDENVQYGAGLPERDLLERERIRAAQPVAMPASAKRVA